MAMIDFLWDRSLRIRLVAALGILLIVAEWWIVPWSSADRAQKWAWAFDPSRAFPVWFKVLFPLALFFAPIRRFLEAVWAKVSQDPSRILNISLIAAGGGILFWLLRVGGLELGDAKIIMDYFVALTTYASVREPLESVLHTDFASMLWNHWGIHPQTGFQILSCLWGCFALATGGIGLTGWGMEKKSFLPAIWFLFLVGPIHLFFGYIEWYTQLAAGLILFEIFGIRQLLTGTGLWVALSGVALAGSSHLVGFGFLPAAVLLIAFSTPPSRRARAVILYLVILAAALGGIFFWLSLHIDFSYSTKATAHLFATLLPLMREDNPNNPPGSWQYPWLSLNHMADLANEILLCGLFPLLLLIGGCPWMRLFRHVGAAFHWREVFRSIPEPSAPTVLEGSEAEHRFGSHLEEEAKTTRIVLFFLPQILLGVVFLLIWNPWLGFPGDWDLFSYFAWPLLAAAVLMAYAWTDAETRGRLFWAAGIPAASMVGAWIVSYHHGSLPRLEEVRAHLSHTMADLRWNEARRAELSGNWPVAFEKAEAVMRLDPKRKDKCLDLLDVPAIQKMSEEWPDEAHLTRMAADFAIISASPARRLFVMDCWGRVFFWEGGYFNAWSGSGVPGIPERHAVAMKIIPWKEAAIILCDDGALFAVPTPSWVDPDPPTPMKTYNIEAPIDRTPRPIGNFYTDYAGVPLHPGAKAVDLGVDYINKRLVALDTAGNVVSDSPQVDYQVSDKPAFVNIDVALAQGGGKAFVGDYFGGIHSWPGKEPHIPIYLGYNWQAIADYEYVRGGQEVYILDVQGDVHPFTTRSSPLIDRKMIHYGPYGNPMESFHKAVYPLKPFHKIQLVPKEKSFYRMNWNFYIDFSEAAGELESASK
jgi:hypothetical protein